MSSTRINLSYSALEYIRDRNLSVNSTKYIRDKTRGELCRFHDKNLGWKELKQMSRHAWLNHYIYMAVDPTSRRPWTPLHLDVDHSVHALHCAPTIFTQWIMTTRLLWFFDSYTQLLSFFNLYPANLVNFQPLEVVSRYRDPQPQVAENYSYLFNLRPSIYILMSKQSFYSQYQWFNRPMKQIKNDYCRDQHAKG